MISTLRINKEQWTLWKAKVHKMSAVCSVICRPHMYRWERRRKLQTKYAPLKVVEKRDWFTSKCALLLSLTHPSKICSSNPCGFGLFHNFLQGTSCRVTSKKAVLPNRCVQFRDRRLTTAESPVAYHCIENASATLAFRALMFFLRESRRGRKRPLCG